MLMDCKNIVKTSILPKTIYTFTTISIKNSDDTFHRNRKKIPKFLRNHKRP